MKSVKSIINSKPQSHDQIRQFPVPDIDPDRFSALKNIIIQAHLACAHTLPEAEFVNALIISWNAALRRVPTKYLEPALQFAIENYNLNSKITCNIIYRAFRELLVRTNIRQSYQLPGPRTVPPKEYYDLLAKMGIFPKPAAAPSKSSLKRYRPEYKIEKRGGICQCGSKVKILVIFQDKQLCLDCAIRAEILKKDSQ